MRFPGISIQETPTHLDKMAAWKELERRAAEKTGGKRIVRANDFSAPDLDIDHKTLAIDCKYRKSLATFGWFRKLENDVKKLKRHQNKIPLLILKEKGRQGELAVCRLEVFLELLEGSSYSSDSPR